MKKSSIAINRSKMPQLGKKQNLTLHMPETIVLDNGIKLFVINDEAAQVTRLDFIFYAGTSFQQKKLVATAANKLLCEGTENFSSFKISKTLDYHGAFLDQFINKDTAGISLYALTKYYPKLLPLLNEMVTKASFPQNELTIYLDRELQDFKLKTSKVRYKAMLEFNKMMFGQKSPYGQIAEENDFQHVERQDVLDFYNSMYNSTNSYIILSGKSDRKLIMLINNYFGQQWNALEKTRYIPMKFTTRYEKKKLFIKKEDALQSAIRIGRNAMDKTHSDYNTLVLLNTLLGGYFGSRLMSSLREKKGLTYGINSFVKNFRNGSYFTITTEVNATQTEQAVEEIYNQLKILQNFCVDNDELKLVKNYLYGTFLRSFDGSFALADRFKNVKDFNLTFDFYKKQLNDIMNIKPEQLREFANSFLDKDNLKLLVVGNISEFE